MSQSEAHKRHYAKHREEVKRKAYERRQAVQKQLAEYKATKACERCGFAHPAVIDFHHRNPTEKRSTVSAMVTNGFPWYRILEEIAKCEVLCANCHRIEHYTREKC